MNSRRRSLIIVVVGLTLASGVLGEEPIPPLPLVSKSKEGVILPEMRSPCTIDLDAQWLKPLKTTDTEFIKIKVPHPVNCDGAVIKSVLARGRGSVTIFQFTVTFRPGSDREGIVSFGIIDSDKQLVALGEARDNLDEGAESYLSGTLTLKNKEFDRVFAKGQEPVLRITLRLEDN